MNSRIKINYFFYKLFFYKYEKNTFLFLKWRKKRKTFSTELFADLI